MNANQQYLERRKLIEREISILKQELEAMDLAQAKEKNNYGFSGNCGYILSQIQELNKFLAGY